MKFIAPHTVEVQLNGGGTRTLTGDRVFLNLGTHASIPPVLGLAEASPLTHIEMLELDRIPEHLIVIGGGYVGLEFTQAYRRFGSRVTIIQHGPKLLASEDPDVVDEVSGISRSRGHTILTSAEIQSVQGSSGVGVKLKVRTPGGENVVEGSDILVATGRTPNTSGIGLELAGIELDGARLSEGERAPENNVPAVWGIGERAGTPQFTHVSMDDFRIIRDNLAGGNRSTADRIIPSVFTPTPRSLASD